MADFDTDDATAQAVIEALDLSPHPEGGAYVETWRDGDAGGARGAGTAIYFLLKADEVSAWHRVDTTEIWHHYAGAPIELTLRRVEDGVGISETIRLGPDVLGGERPQGIVPPGVWQTAKALGGWALVGCTCSPAFRFEGFELSDPPA